MLYPLNGLFKRTYSSKGLTKLYNLQGRYATALFNAADKTKKLKDVESEIIKVKSFILKNKEIQQFLENPTVGRDVKKEIVVSMLSKQKYSDIIVNFFKAMADNGRLNDSLKVISSFEQLMKDYNSEIQVRIVSNQVLSKEIQQKLETIVQNKFVSKDKKATINWKVDEKIKGGFIIEIGDNVIDMSVASKANAITKDLMNSI